MILEEHKKHGVILHEGALIEVIADESKNVSAVKISDGN
jgi:hypothetical protein